MFERTLPVGSVVSLYGGEKRLMILGYVKYLKGDEGMAQAAAERIVGSRDLYEASHRKNVSVNFITCHDGMTLYDLYSYNQKHNEKNNQRKEVRNQER